MTPRPREPEAGELPPQLLALARALARLAAKDDAAAGPATETGREETKDACRP